MNELNFCYWLQGFFELKKTIDHREGFSPDTVKVIEEHLQLVFKKVTPVYQFPPITTLPQKPIFNMPTIGDGIALQVTC